MSNETKGEIAMSNGYRYVGGKARYRGVPSRDLTQEQFDRLGPLEQRTVLTSGGWKPLTAKEVKAAEAEAKRLAEEAAAKEAEEAARLAAEEAAATADAEGGDTPPDTTKDGE